MKRSQLLTSAMTRGLLAVPSVTTPHTKAAGVVRTSLTLEILRMEPSLIGAPLGFIRLLSFSDKVTELPFEYFDALGFSNSAIHREFGTGPYAQIVGYLTEINRQILRKFEQFFHAEPALYVRHLFPLRPTGEWKPQQAGE